jgi:hypothetical protein
MKYAVKDVEGEVMSIFDADSFVEAVAIKRQLQSNYSDMLGVDEVFSVAEAMQEIRAFAPTGRLRRRTQAAISINSART